MSIFSDIKIPRIGSNHFDLSCDVKMSFQMGKLTPTHIQEVIPGDQFTISTETFLRMAPLAAPVMHKMDVYHHWFYVPNRLLWDGWEKFVTGGQLYDPTTPAFPYITNFAVEKSSLGDYMGLPTTDPTPVDEQINAMPFAAYQMIYNEYYRDQNLEQPIDYKLNDGNNLPLELLKIRRRAWEHDYFTSALPWAQKGDPVPIPFEGNDVNVTYTRTGTGGQVYTHNAAGIGTGGVYTGGASGDTAYLQDHTGKNLDYDPKGTLKAETSELENSSTINDLRLAIRLQDYLEKAARGGTRLTEWVYEMFGIKSSDARLQRPQFLGGTKQPMVISEVLQTSETADTPQGNMSGHGVSVGDGKRISFRAEEHGFIIGIISVMPKTSYQQGIPKVFLKQDKFDFAIPSFAHLGEQPIVNKELKYLPGQSINNDTFGYVPRYTEYKFNMARTSGDFRDSLSYWTLTRIFSGIATPTLSEEFIQCDPSTRIFAVEDPTVEDHIYGHLFHRINARRKLPRFADPSKL